MENTYNDDSIDLLIGAERIRKRPASMLGSSGLQGSRHGFIEIYGNALDEKTAGYGDRLDVKLYKDNSISLRDYGRGVPLGWNNKKSIKNWNWHIVYNELYGGGKYEDYQDELSKITDWSKFDPHDYNYLFSVGLNGLGAASTQYTSEFFEVKSNRGGICTSRSFAKGVPLVDNKPFDMFTASKEQIEAIPEEICETQESDGTYIHWKPDDEVFDDTNVGADWLLETCRDISTVAGVTLTFEDEATGNVVEFKSGTLADTVVNHAGNSLVLNDNGEPVLMSCDSFDHGTTKVEGKNYIWVCMCNIVFGFTKSHTDNACYHNSVKMMSGYQYEAVQDAIAMFMQERGKVAGVKIDRRDYEDAFNVVVSTYSNYASFRNQTKDAVDDVFIYKIVKDTLYSKLKLEWSKSNRFVVELVNRVVDEAKSRVEAQELQELARKVNKVKKERLPLKFVSCDAYEEKRYDEVEIWITEGDSAGRSVKSARNKAFQAVFPIRGKGLNVLKKSDKRILENKEIRELFAILGTGFDLNSKKAKFFNMDDLKVGKIIFATDADSDGYQIRVLLFLVFYKLAPELIRAGKVFIAESPRFGLLLTDGSKVYAKNDIERDELLEEYAGRVSKVERYKGLGEFDAEILRETTVHPDHRNLVPVTCDFENQVERDLIDALFGADKYKQRKMIISSVLGSDVVDMLTDNALMIGEIDELDIEDSTEYEEVVVGA